MALFCRFVVFEDRTFYLAIFNFVVAVLFIGFPFGDIAIKRILANRVHGILVNGIFHSDTRDFLGQGKGRRDAGQNVPGVQGAYIMVAYVEGPGGHWVELIEYFSPADRGKVESRPCYNGFAHLAYDVDAAVAASAAYGFLPLGTPVSID